MIAVDLRPRWGAFGALPVCPAQRTPMTYDVSPATMLFNGGQAGHEGFAIIINSLANLAGEEKVSGPGLQPPLAGRTSGFSRS